MKKLLYILLLLLPSISLAATTHHYTCAELSITAGSPTCSADAWTFANTEVQTVDDISGVALDLQGVTWYVSWTQTGGQEIRYLCDNYPTSCTFNGHSATFTAQSWAVSAGTPTGFIITNNVGGGVYHSGVVSNVCVTDTSGDCEATPSGGTTASTTYMFVDNPPQDIFNGLVLFITSFWGIIWFFRKRT